MLIRLATSNDPLPNIIVLAIALVISLLLGLTLHELSHALVADRLGDPGPRFMGRISLNPLHHLDPAGTLMLFIVGFGWAKPVQVDPNRLRNGPVVGMATVAGAGPIMNFLLALLFAIPFQLGVLSLELPFARGGLNIAAFTPINYLSLLVFYLVNINVILGIFNLIPLAPLDGSRVFQALLPGSAGDFFRRIEPYGMGILFLLVMLPLVTGGRVDPIGWIVFPVQNWLLNLLLR